MHDRVLVSCKVRDSECGKVEPQSRKMRDDGSQWDHIFVLAVRRDNRKAMATSLFASHCLMGCNNQAVECGLLMSMSWPHVLYPFRM